MTMTDPIADMLTRIRNANTAGHDTVEIPASKMKKSIAQILKDEGFINDFEVIEDGKQGIIKVTMKYAANKEKVISGLNHDVTSSYYVFMFVIFAINIIINILMMIFIWIKIYHQIIRSVENVQLVNDSISVV